MKRSCQFFKCGKFNQKIMSIFILIAKNIKFQVFISCITLTAPNQQYIDDLHMETMSVRQCRQWCCEQVQIRHRSTSQTSRNR